MTLQGSKMTFFLDFSADVLAHNAIRIGQHRKDHSFEQSKESHDLMGARTGSKRLPRKA